MQLIDFQNRMLTVAGAVPTPDDFRFGDAGARVPSPGVLVMNVADGKGFDLAPDLQTVRCVFDVNLMSAVIIPPQPGETGVLNPVYPPGDCRRYGVFPDGVTNWEGLYSPRVAAWMAACTLPGVIGLMPPGHYASGFNWSSLAYANARVRMWGASIGGIWHLQSSAEPTIGEPKLSGLVFEGDADFYDRYGVNNVDGVKHKGVIRLRSDPAKSTIGVKGRGAHLYFGTRDLQIDGLIIEDATNVNNTDAAFAGDGNGDLPVGIKIGFVDVLASDTHGAYLSGFEWDIEEFRVRSYGALQPSRQVQGAQSLAQSQRACGFWANRATGKIKELIVEQGPGERPHAIHDVLIHETDVNGPRRLEIGKIRAPSIGRGGFCQGITFGDADENTGAAAQLNVEVGGIEATLYPGAVLPAGKHLVNVNNRLGGTSITFGGNVDAINPDAQPALAIAAGARVTWDAGKLRYLARGGTARGSALTVDGGGIYLPNGIDYAFNGASATPQIAKITNPLPGSRVGPINATATIANSKRVLELVGTVDFQIGPIAAGNFWLGGGTILINGCSNTWVYLATVSSPASALASAPIGLRWAGTNTDVHVVGGKITGFATGVTKVAGAVLTRCTATNAVATGNTTNSTLTAAELTQIGACLGMTV
jgi:hypothetical protein